MTHTCYFIVFFSSRRRHTRCALVTGVQTCALPICLSEDIEQLHFRHPNSEGHLSQKAYSLVVLQHLTFPRTTQSLLLTRIPQLQTSCRQIGRASCRERVCQYV